MQPRRLRARLRARRRSGLVVLAVLAGLTAAQGSVSGAAFYSATGNAGDSWVATSLQPPSGLTVTQVCTNDPVPVLHGSSTATSGTGALALTEPGGTVAGDLMLATVAIAGSPPESSLVAPAGWTKVGGGVHTGGATTATYYRWATSSAAATHPWTLPSSQAVGGILAYGGVHPKHPIDGYASSTSDGGDKLITSTSLTTTTTNVRLVAFFSQINTSTWTPPPGMSEVYDIATTSGAGPSGDLSQESAAEARPVAGATGTRTATSTTGGKGTGQLIALRPSATPSAALSWSASPSTITTGYRERRSVAGVLQRETAVAGRTTTTTSDGPLVNGTAYRFDVAATLQSWVSPATTGTLTPDC